MATGNGKVAGLLIRAALQYLRKTAKRKRDAERAERRQQRTYAVGGGTGYRTVLPPTQKDT